MSIMKKVSAIFFCFFFTGSLAAQDADIKTNDSLSEKKTKVEQHLWFNVEGGGGWQSVNDVEIPYPNATRFSLVDFGRGPFFVYRFYLGYEINRHYLRAMVAPLTVQVSGKPAQDISFQKIIFPAGVETTGYYTFNSYRLTYAYALVKDDNFIFRLGFTGKIRDAEIRLKNQFSDEHRANVGFVPLINLGLEYNFWGPLWFTLDADALWSPYGRAEDVALKLRYDVNPWLNLEAGYRMVEGGAGGGGGVYNFAWLHYAVFSARFTFF